MKYRKEDEEVISQTIGYPYNILPKGYPNKVSDAKIEEVMEKFLQTIKANAGVEAIVNRDLTFVNLGLNELNSRTSRKQSRIAFWLSILSVIFAGSSLVISALSYANGLCSN
jgi:hypothetical protein